MANSKSTATVAKAAPKTVEAKKTETAVTVPSDTPYQLNLEQTIKACKALIKFVGSKEDKSAKKNLLDDSEVGQVQSIRLNFTTKKFTATSKKLKPILVPLPHPLYDLTAATVCLIVKDPQRTYKDLVEAAGLSSTVTRVISVSKLRSKFKSFESRRLLRDSHDVFIADDSVVRMLPQVLGKSFFDSSKIPIPVELKPNAEKLKKTVEKTLSCTTFNLVQSATLNMRVGMSSFTGEQVAENVKAVVDNVLGNKKLPGGWRGVRGIHIKTPSSVALPIWLTPQIFDEDDILTPEATALKEKKQLEIRERQAGSKARRMEKKREGRGPQRDRVKARKVAALRSADKDGDVDMEDVEEKKPAEEKVSKSTEKLVDASVKEQKKRKKIADVLDKGLDASVKEAKKLKAKKL